MIKVEAELPLHLTFQNIKDAHTFVEQLSLAQEDVTWETRRLEDAKVMVIILGINNLEKEEEDG